MRVATKAYLDIGLSEYTNVIKHLRRKALVAKLSKIPVTLEQARSLVKQLGRCFAVWPTVKQTWGHTGHAVNGGLIVLGANPNVHILLHEYAHCRHFEESRIYKRNEKPHGKEFIAVLNMILEAVYEKQIQVPRKPYTKRK